MILPRSAEARTLPAFRAASIQCQTARGFGLAPGSAGIQDVKPRTRDRECTGIAALSALLLRKAFLGEPASTSPPAPARGATRSSCICRLSGQVSTHAPARKATRALRAARPPVKNLAHSAFFHACEKTPPSKLGITHFAGKAAAHCGQGRAGAGGNALRPARHGNRRPRAQRGPDRRHQQPAGVRADARGMGREPDPTLQVGQGRDPPLRPVTELGIKVASDIRAVRVQRNDEVALHTPHFSVARRFRLPKDRAPDHHVAPTFAGASATR